MYSLSKKKKRTIPVNSNTSYRREMKLIPINIHFCLLQFDALKFFPGVSLHGGLFLTLIFSMPTPKFDNEIVKCPPSHVDRPIRKILMHQIEVDKNPC